MPIATIVEMATSGGLLCILLALLLAATASSVTAREDNDVSGANQKQLDYLSKLACATADKLITVFEAPFSPLSSSHMHLHSPSSFKQQSNNKDVVRNQRDTQTLKRLLGAVPQEKLKTEESKLDKEIGVIEKAEKLLEKDMSHLSNAKHPNKHSKDKGELEDEINALKKLDSELIAQKDIIKDSQSKPEKSNKRLPAYEEDFTEQGERSGQIDSSDSDESWSNEGTAEEDEDEDISETDFKDGQSELSSEDSEGDFQEEENFIEEDEIEFDSEDSEADSSREDSGLDFTEESDELELGEEEDETDSSEEDSKMDFSEEGAEEEFFEEYSTDRRKREALDTHVAQKKAILKRIKALERQQSKLVQKLKALRKKANNADLVKRRRARIEARKQVNKALKIHAKTTNIIKEARKMGLFRTNRRILKKLRTMERKQARLSQQLNTLSMKLTDTKHSGKNKLTPNKSKPGEMKKAKNRPARRKNRVRNNGLAKKKAMNRPAKIQLKAKKKASKHDSASSTNVAGPEAKPMKKMDKKMMIKVDDIEQSPSDSPTEQKHRKHSHRVAHHRRKRPLSDQKRQLENMDIISSLINTLSDTEEVKVHIESGSRNSVPMAGGSLEQSVLRGVEQAESEAGLSVEEAVSLQKEAESLEHKEEEIVEKLVEDDEAGKKVDALEKRIVLEQLLQDLDSKLEDKISEKKKNSQRRVRSVSDQPSTEESSRHKREQQASWVNALLNQQDVPVQRVITPVSNGETYHDRNGNSREAQPEKRATHKHHKGPHSHHHKHHSSKGQKNMSRCARCEAMVGEEVCGSNGKTYNSMCHAVNCGGLNIRDLSIGPCAPDGVCEGVEECSEGSVCVTLTNGVCLSLYSPLTHKRLTCRQYTCVTESQCTSDAHSQVCGLDGKTYPSLCYLHKAGVQLAYSGMCRPELCRKRVCGRDAVTYSSACHARARGVRVDYPGECFAESFPPLHGCVAVVMAGRCPKHTCSRPVLPKDSCCSVCGGALVVHPDSEAIGALVSTWEDINHMYVIENFLRKLLSVSASTKCELSATLTSAGNISVVLEAIEPTDYSVCRNSAKKLAKAINGHIPAVEDNMLRPMTKTAALVNLFNPLESVNDWAEETHSNVVSGVKTRLNSGIESVDRETDRLEQEHLYNNRSSGPSLTGNSLVVLVLITLLSCIT